MTSNSKVSNTNTRNKHKAMMDQKKLVLAKYLFCPLPTIFGALVNLANLSDNMLQPISSSNESWR